MLIQLFLHGEKMSAGLAVCDGLLAWAKPVAGRRRLTVAAAALAVAATGVAAQPQQPSPPAASASAPASGAGRTAVLRWIAVPRVVGRISSATLGVVINTADPYSVEIGDYYVQRRHIPADHVLRVELPVKARLSEQEALALKRDIDQHFGPQVQGLALAWTQPYAAECQSINAVLAFGFDASLCRQTCDRSKLSAYFNSSSGAPYKDHHVRPSMLLAARTVAQGRSLIDRGVAADHTLGQRGAPPAHAYYMVTGDQPRSSRAPLFPPPSLFSAKTVQIHVQRGSLPTAADRVFLVQTGLPRVDGMGTVNWLPGALADHLTSSGGYLDTPPGHGQTSALEWLEAGVTASYGTVSEPCNHPQKFPHPQVLLLHYLQGSTALEAYWKSVAWPQQGVFVGEPLAAPFAPRLRGAAP